MASRYSIIPADFVDDGRPTLIHYQVIVSLGRRTNKSGWCFISQTKLAAKLGFQRQGICTAIHDLVEWGYVEKEGQATTKRNICKYRVLMDRTVLEDDVPDGIVDDGAPPQEDPDSSADVSGTSDTHVSGTSDTHVSGTSDTSVRSHRTPRVRSHRTPYNDLLLSTPPPQLPRGGCAASPDGRGGDLELGWAKGWNQPARDELDRLTQAHPNVRTFLDAVRGLLNPPATVDAASYAATLSRLGRYDAAVLRSLADEMILKRDRDLPSVAHLVALADKTLARLATSRNFGSAKAPAAERRLVRLKQGSPEFEAWLRDQRKRDPESARRVEAQGFVQIEVSR